MHNEPSGVLIHPSGKALVIPILEDSQRSPWRQPPHQRKDFAKGDLANHHRQPKSTISGNLAIQNLREALIVSARREFHLRPSPHAFLLQLGIIIAQSISSRDECSHVPLPGLLALRRLSFRAQPA